MASGISVENSSQQQNESQVPGQSRGKLVQRLLAASDNLPAFINDLLTTQAVSVAGTEAAAFLIDRMPPQAQTGESPVQQTPEFSLRPIAHIRPDQSSIETRQAALAAFQDIIRPCIAQTKDGAVEISGSQEVTGESQFCLVTLLRSEGQVVAVSAVITRCRDLERAKQRLMSMQLVAGYFELYSLKRTSEQARMIAASHQQVLQLASSVSTADGFESAAMNLCNELAGRTGAARVSIGWMRGNHIKVKALSHTEKFDKKQELIVELAKAMEECVDQEEAVQYDPNGPGTQNVTRAAQNLSRSQGGHIVLSLPLRHKSEVVGVVTLEFLPDQKLHENAAAGLAVAVDLLAPQLYDRYQNDRYLITKAGISARETAKMVIGPKHMLAKLVVSLLLATVVFISIYKPMYKVSAGFQLVPVEKRTVTVPFNGHIEEVLVETGEQVTKGQPLVKLRTFDLEQKLLEVEGRIAQHRTEIRMHANNEREGSHAEAQIAQAKLEQAAAEATLIKSQIEKATIRAEIDGTVLEGDLRDMKGAAVEQGKALFVIGDPKNLRVEISVPERDIQELLARQREAAEKGEAFKGYIATETFPDRWSEVKVTRIVPMGRPKEGENMFTVYAEVDPSHMQGTWSPGVQGLAKLEIERRRVIWIWTHRVVDYVRLNFWL